VEIKQYRIKVNAVRATLVYYVSEYDIDTAINLAIEAPFKEWEVSDFDMPLGADVEAEEI
jgi:hypothetical protein